MIGQPGSPASSRITSSCGCIILALVIVPVTLSPARPNAVLLLLNLTLLRLPTSSALLRGPPGPSTDDNPIRTYREPVLFLKHFQRCHELGRALE